MASPTRAAPPAQRLGSVRVDIGREPRFAAAPAQTPAGVENAQRRIFGGVLTITDVLAVPATGGYFADDQAAIKAGAVRDGLAYPPGVRAPSEAVSLLLVLSDGHVAHGDCVSVQYSGVGGREPRLRAAELSARLAARARAGLRGGAVPSFLDTDALVEGTAARYGLSQALLDAAAHRPARRWPRSSAPSGG